MLDQVRQRVSLPAGRELLVPVTGLRAGLGAAYRHAFTDDPVLSRERVPRPRHLQPGGRPPNREHPDARRRSTSNP